MKPTLAEPLSATRTGEFAATELVLGSHVAGRYRIERLLGIGAMGLVYLAFDEQLDIQVALKVLRPELARRADAFARFRQELLLARQVSSPHVVRIHDLVQHGETVLLSMDFVAGESLQQLIEREAPLPLERALNICRELALGLAAAHAREVIHRDLKPANVLLDADGHAYISDFGVARAAGATRLTGTGMVVGTPDYLSPEQARADALDGRSDQYALGLIFHEMLTGKLPFGEGTAAEMLARRVLNEVPGLATLRSDLPRDVIHLCDRMLRRDARQRFADCHAVARAIEQRNAGAPPRAPRSRSWWLSVLVIALVLALGYSLLRQAPTREIAAETWSLAVLPVAGGTADAETDRIGRQINEWLLLHIPGVLDGDRTRRALRTLSLQANDAAEHADLIAGLLPVRQVLAPRLVINEGVQRLELDLHDANGQRISTWSRELGVEAVADLLPDLLRQLGGRSSGTIDRATLDAFAEWSALEAQGATAEARAAARDWLDQHLDDAPLQRRTRAYAEFLVDSEHAGAALLAAQALWPQDHPIQLLRARLAGDSGDLEAASALLSRVVAEDERHIEAWFLLGKYALMQGDARRAVDDYLVRALVLAKRQDDLRWRGEIANAFGVGYRNLGRMAQAAEEYREAVRLRNQRGDARGEAVSRRNLAVALSYLGRHSEARDELAAARGLLEPLGDPAAMADVVNDLGVLAEERGEFRAALDAYREALAYRQRAGDPRPVGESLINVGFAYFQVGEFDNALLYWQQANEVYAGIDDASGSVRAEQGLALAQIAKGQAAAARAALERSLHRSTELQMSEERAVALVSLAELDRLEGRFAASLQYAAEATAAFQTLEDERGRVESQLVSLQAQIDIGAIDLALATVASLSATPIQNGEQRAMLANRQAELALLQSNPNEGIRHAEAASGEAESAGALAHALMARIVLAEAQYAAGRAQAARTALEQALDQLDAYASLPLRLRWIEAAVRIAEPMQGVLAEARHELAAWPQYGRAARIEALAAERLDGTAADQARDRAAQHAQVVYAALAEAQRPAFRRLLASLHIPFAEPESP